MQKVKLYFTRAGRTDDVIQIFDDETHNDMFRVVYTPAEYIKTSNEFYGSTSTVMDYISSVLKSMCYDNDPFDYLQISTAIHPSVMYSIADVSDPKTRYQIEDLIEQATKEIVGEVKLKRNVRTPFLSPLNANA
jgi:hypothetical protein